MLPRRIRGVLTSALVWGTLGALGMSAVMPIILLADPRTRSIHALRSLFVDIVPGLFAYMAALGGLLALVVAIVGRSVTTEELTTMRFEVWGGVAGAPAGLGLATLQALESATPSHTPLKLFGSMIIGGAYIGAQNMWLMLYVPRRSRAKLRA